MFAYGLIAIGLVTLVAGAEVLVRGASRLANAAGVSSLIIGLTVVAFGTSAPEMAVSVASSLSGRADIAVGNVVGSNIFNVLLILGLSASITPLFVAQKLIRFDVPLMIAASFLTWWFCSDGIVDRTEGCVLFAGILAFTAQCLIVGRQESMESRHDATYSVEPGCNESESVRSGVSGLLWQVVLVAGGLALLVLGATWLVNGATEVARRLGLSELVIGLTIVAAGTSLPELATSLVAAVRGERDIAVGNVVGSNLFNLLGVLGLTAIVAPSGITVASQAVQFDIPVMVAVAVCCLPVFFTGHQITRWEGGLFLAYFGAYTIALVLMASDRQALPTVRWFMLGFVIPLTVIPLIVAVARVGWQRPVAKRTSELEGVRMNTEHPENSTKVKDS